MPIFKYTVTNTEGKKLSGTVEASDEQIAREELNNLGFTILTLQETQVEQKEDPSKTKFEFEATDKTGKLVNGTIPAKTQEEALAKLKTEYSLIVSAIWPQGSSQEQVEEAKKTGAINLQEEEAKASKEQKGKELEEKKEDDEESLSKDPQLRKKELKTRTKIDNILNDVNQLLQTFDKEFDPTQKSEIQKKIDKLLRIKNSKNLDYILVTAEDLLDFIKKQAEKKDKPGDEESTLKLKLETGKILNTLKDEEKKSISENITEKIDEWEKKHGPNKFISPLLNKIKSALTVPPEIKVQKQKIRALNKELKDLIKLYFKEPTPKYKAAVKENLKTTWETRKKAIRDLKTLKKQLKTSGEVRQGEDEEKEENILFSFVEELNSLTGWLLAFYLIYYFSALYLNTKDFGLVYVPEGFEVYTSRIFKYILVVLFLLHSSTAIKVNFFRGNMLANIIIIPAFIIASIIAILNF